VRFLWTLLLCIAVLTPVGAIAQPLGHRASDVPRPPAARKIVLRRPAAATLPSHPAVVRVIVAEKDGQSLGSGTLIDVKDPYALVVTNWHVIREAAGEINVIFPDGFRSPARVVQHDADWDLAALSIWKPNVLPVRISTELPKIGEPLTIAGYGSDGAFRAVSGRCTQYMSPSEKHPREIVELAAVARQGDSGGPIFNQRGELAGVLFGSVDNTTSGSYGGRVLQFLEPLLKADAVTSAPPAVAASKAGEPPPKSPAVTLPGIDDQLKSMNPTAPPETAAPLAAVSADDPGLQGEEFQIEHTPLDATFPGFTPGTAESTGGWTQDFVGRTPIEQGKAALSIVGLFSLLMFAMRFGKERKSEE
jgi:hypothetical protein